jgi:response regulator of citrate/malate metabolism
MTEKEIKASPIVVIDDDEMAHFLFKAIIKRYNPALPITSFSTAFEVIELIKQNSFQATLIILDINMPKMNGWEFLKELEVLNYTVPVYILSSSEDAADRNRARDYKNVLGYFVKPLTFDQFGSIVDKYFPKNKEAI